MKRFINVLASVVLKAPWAVIGVTVIVSLIFGFLSGNFTQEEDSNASFAPASPEIEASDRIEDLFGSSESIMQILISSDSGDVVTADGLAAVRAVRGTLASGAFADRLSTAPGRPAIVSYLALVEGFGGTPSLPPAASDQDVKDAFALAYTDAPAELSGFVGQLLPEGTEPEAATSEKGLILVFHEGPEDSDEFEAFVDITVEAADEIAATQLPPGISADAFSTALLFGDDEFQAEIGRLFATAFFIIIAVLALVFLVVPRRRSRRLLTIGGFAVMVVMLSILILPGLAKLFPDVLPEGIADWSVGVILPAAAAGFLLVFVLWSVTSRLLRRTVADTLVTLMAIFFAISWMNGYGYLRFGDASPMAQILPILLIGLGVDYSIHMTSRYREEVSSGQTVDQSVARAIRTVGVALVLATLTTAVGFLTNVFNEIPALREFGELAAVGIAASFILMLTLVPAVRLLLDRRGVARGTLESDQLLGGQSRALPRLIGRTAWLAHKAPVYTVVGALLLGVFGAYGVTQLETKFSFIDFVPTTSPIRDTFATLLDEFGPRESTQVLVDDDPTTAAAWNGMAASFDNISTTDQVFVAAGRADAESPVTFVAQLVDPSSSDFDAAVADVAGRLGLGDDLRLPDGTDVEPLYDAAFTANSGFMERVLATDDAGAYTAALITITSQAGEQGASRLAADLRTAVEPLTEQGISAVPTSSEIINDVVVTSLRDSQVSSLLLTLLAALALLVANFWAEARRPFLGVITTIPVVLVVMWAFGIMAALGIPFGPVTATISALAIGIGIPYMIHITHRYQEDRLRHAEADDAIKSTLTHTGGALAGSAITTIAGFGILVTSTTIPFRQFGFVTAYTIGLALLAAILVLPSMLVLWDRWHRNRGEDPLDRAAVEDALQEDLSLVD